MGGYDVLNISVARIGHNLTWYDSTGQLGTNGHGFRGIAVRRRAGMTDFDGILEDEAAQEFMRRVDMVFDPEVEQNYPATWMGKVSVTTKGGTVFTDRIEEPKGDPGNTLTRGEIEKKARSLAEYGGALDGDGWTRVSRRLWSVASLDEIGSLLR